MRTALYRDPLSPHPALSPEYRGEGSERDLAPGWVPNSDLEAPGAIRANVPDASEYLCMTVGGDDVLACELAD